MKTFQELKRNQKHDLSEFPTVKLALVGGTATQLLAATIRGMSAVGGGKY